jgi:hypothetical protein
MWTLRLAPLVTLGAVATVVFIGATQASGSTSCAKGSWPAGTRSIAVPPPASARVSFSHGRWRLWLRPAARRGLTGRVAADGALSSVRASGALRSRLHHTGRALSFVMPAGSAPARVSFTARCAHRIAFDFAGVRTLIGRQPAPASGFQLQTGVTGRLILGPICPLAGRTRACASDRGVHGTVEIDTAPASGSTAGTPVETVATDANGNFSAALSPGDYTFTGRSSGPQPPAGTMSRSSSAHVAPGAVSQVTVVFDTGIR